MDEYIIFTIFDMYMCTIHKYIDRFFMLSYVQQKMHLLEIIDVFKII